MPARSRSLTCSSPSTWSSLSGGTVSDHRARRRRGPGARSRHDRPGRQQGRPGDGDRRPPAWVLPAAIVADVPRALWRPSSLLSRLAANRACPQLPHSLLTTGNILLARVLQRRIARDAERASPSFGAIAVEKRARPSEASRRVKCTRRVEPNAESVRRQALMRAGCARGSLRLYRHVCHVARDGRRSPIGRVFWAPAPSSRRVTRPVVRGRSRLGLGRQTTEVSGNSLTALMFGVPASPTTHRSSPMAKPPRRHAVSERLEIALERCEVASHLRTRTKGATTRSRPRRTAARSTTTTGRRTA
jgi:hypothetical protein